LQHKAKLSKSISKNVAQAPETARFKRYKAAVQQQGNGKTAEALALGIIKDVCNLAENDTIKAEIEHHVYRLHDAIDKLLKIEPSVLNESLSNNFNAYSNSRQFNTLRGT
jgi:hypothetical protein